MALGPLCLLTRLSVRSEGSFLTDFILIFFSLGSYLYLCMHDTVSEKMSQWLKINQKVSFYNIASEASNIYFQLNLPKS